MDVITSEDLLEGLDKLIKKILRIVIRRMLTWFGHVNIQTGTLANNIVLRNVEEKWYNTTTKSHRTGWRLLQVTVGRCK